MTPCLQGVAGIVSAMVPCLRLYAYLALQLAKAFPEADHEYTGGFLLGAGGVRWGGGGWGGVGGGEGALTYMAGTRDTNRQLNRA